jgi:hydroxymethylbilane synthase
MKDVPAQMPQGFVIGALLQRADPRDALLCRTSGRAIAELPAGARLGTSSLRRTAQILAARPDLRIEPLRGNVGTRLKRLEDGELDAMVLACAGLARLGLESHISARLDPAAMLPAVGQGAIGIECRDDDAPTRALLRALDDAATRTALAAERSFALALGGSCQSPIAALAEIEGERVTLTGLVAEPDGSRLLRDTTSGACARAEQLGEELAQRLLEAGGRELLERLRTA